MRVESVVTIGVLLPDQLGTYADSGNATVLAQRLRWRGIPAEVIAITADHAPPIGCDIYLLGGGEDAAQSAATEWLAAQRALLYALRDTALTLAVCAGMQILGRHVTDVAGVRFTGLGLLDITTTPAGMRAVGEITTRCCRSEVGLLTGFENHRGETILGPGVQPLGRVETGVGNSRSTRVDGVLTGHIIGTYLHGPVLARNPALADLILERVVNRPLPDLHVPGTEMLRRSYLQGRRGWFPSRK